MHRIEYRNFIELQIEPTSCRKNLWKFWITEFFFVCGNLNFHPEKYGWKFEFPACFFNSGNLIFHPEKNGWKFGFRNFFFVSENSNFYLKKFGVPHSQIIFPEDNYWKISIPMTFPTGKNFQLTGILLS